MPHAVAQSRLAVAGAPDRLEAAGDEFHARVAHGYAALAAADPERWVVVDGAGTVGEVHQRVQAAVDARFPEPGPP